MQRHSPWKVFTIVACMLLSAFGVRTDYFGGKAAEPVGA